MTSHIISAILTLVFIEIGVIEIYLFRKLTGHEERFIELSIEYIAAYTKGLFPAAIGAMFIAFVIWFIGWETWQPTTTAMRVIMCGMDKLDLMLIVILSINFGYLLSGAILMCGGKRKWTSSPQNVKTMRYDLIANILSSASMPE